MHAEHLCCAISACNQQQFPCLGVSGGTIANYRCWINNDNTIIATLKENGDQEIKSNSYLAFENFRSLLGYKVVGHAAI